MNDIQARIDEISQKIEELRREETALKSVSGVRSEGYHDPYSDQTYGSGDPLETSKYNPRLQEISIDKKRLEKELKRLESLRDSQMHKPQMHKPQGENKLDNVREKAQLPKDKASEKFLEEERLRTFKEVKGKYKVKGRRFERFMNFITGKKPRWRQIKNYSQKELDHLLATFYGETAFLSEHIKYMENYNDSKDNKNKHTPGEMRKRISNRKWDEFVRQLQNKQKLAEAMRYEAAKRGRGGR